MEFHLFCTALLKAKPDLNRGNKKRATEVAQIALRAL
jgi:hypothetical protein